MKLEAYLSLHRIDAKSFASTLDVSPKAVQHWLRGHRTPRTEQMQKIIAATDGAVFPNDFLPPTPSAPAPAPASQPCEAVE